MDLKKYNLFENLAKDIPEWINNIHIVNPSIVETRVFFLMVLRQDFDDDDLKIKFFAYIF